MGLLNLGRGHCIAAGLIAFVWSASPALAQCRASDSTAVRMVAKYTNMMTRAADPQDLAVLQMQLGRHGISLVPPSQISLVTDRQVCSKAERAYSTALKGNGTTPSGSVYVVKMGSYYVVRDPAQLGSGYYVEMILDSAFRIRYRFLA